MLFPKSRQYGDDTIKEAVSKIEKMEADFGGTEIERPLA